jgi:hypothetical protein
MRKFTGRPGNKRRTLITCLKLNPKACLVHDQLSLTKIALTKILAKILRANIRTSGKNGLATTRVCIAYVCVVLLFLVHQAV